jgi:hypothetical protein
MCYPQWVIGPFLVELSGELIAPVDAPVARRGVDHRFAPDLSFDFNQELLQQRVGWVAATLAGRLVISDRRKFARVIPEEFTEDARLHEPGQVPAQEVVAAAKQPGFFGGCPIVFKVAVDRAAFRYLTAFLKFIFCGVDLSFCQWLISIPFIIGMISYLTLYKNS